MWKSLHFPRPRLVERLRPVAVADVAAAQPPSNALPSIVTQLGRVIAMSLEDDSPLLHFLDKQVDTSRVTVWFTCFIPFYSIMGFVIVECTFNCS